MSAIDAIKKNFFDRDKVQRAVDKSMRQSLSKFGAFVRTRSRSSIRKRKKPSPPGSPPSSHTGLLKKFIYFSYDEASKTVVIGPMAFRASATAPELLEYGGAGVVSQYVTRRGQKRRAGQWRPRPFMRPAYATELPKFMGSLKDSIKE